MRSLREKLSQLTSFGPAPAASERRAEDAGFLPAVQTPHGPVQFLQQVHGPDFVQGKVRVAAARIVQGATVASLALDASLAELDLSRMLMIDTETTGLQGGAGTLPWVIGISWFEGELLVVRQLFLGRPGAEAPLLRMLAEKIEAASVLVTFNGKCFDWPLLRTRFVLNRIAAPAPRPHLDLLHCARRIFKRRLGGTRLQDLEAAVLGFQREGDIAGADIPAVYFDWLRSGLSAQVERV
ncbi:MAG: Glutamate synthase large chain, partial [Myxococcaceae bacterium]|nr:Glutamate synthase large chain [Myxococcaceae bacterium]